MKSEKLLAKIRRQSANVRFRDLCQAAESCGFELRAIRGSHHRYHHGEHPDAIINLQPRGGMAKEYQVKQFLTLVDRYNLQP